MFATSSMNILWAFTVLSLLLIDNFSVQGSESRHETLNRDDTCPNGGTLVKILEITHIVTYPKIINKYFVTNTTIECVGNVPITIKNAPTSLITTCTGSHSYILTSTISKPIGESTIEAAVATAIRPKLPTYTDVTMSFFLAVVDAPVTEPQKPHDTFAVKDLYLTHVGRATSDCTKAVSYQILNEKLLGHGLPISAWPNITTEVMSLDQKPDFISGRFSLDQEFFLEWRNFLFYPNREAIFVQDENGFVSAVFNGKVQDGLRTVKLRADIAPTCRPYNISLRSESTPASLLSKANIFRDSTDPSSEIISRNTSASTHVDLSMLDFPTRVSSVESQSIAFKLSSTKGPIPRISWSELTSISSSSSFPTIKNSTPGISQFRTSNSSDLSLHIFRNSTKDIPSFREFKTSSLISDVDPTSTGTFPRSSGFSTSIKNVTSPVSMSLPVLTSVAVSKSSTFNHSFTSTAFSASCKVAYQPGSTPQSINNASLTGYRASRLSWLGFSVAPTIGSRAQWRQSENFTDNLLFYKVSTNIILPQFRLPVYGYLYHAESGLCVEVTTTSTVYPRYQSGTYTLQKCDTCTLNRPPQSQRFAVANDVKSAGVNCMVFAGDAAPNTIAPFYAINRDLDAMGFAHAKFGDDMCFYTDFSPLR